MTRWPTVLVIDDDEFLCQGLEYALRKMGVEPVITRDAGRFKELAAEKDFDLFLIGVHFQNGASGLGLVESIRKMRGARPRIMMMSGASDTETIARAIRCGANDYILKPLDRAHLAAKLSRYFLTQRMAEIGMLGEVAEGRSPGRLTCQAEIAELDEHGVRLTSPHLLPKGVSLLLGGTLLSEIAGPRGPSGPLPVKVISSWTEASGSGADRALHGAYAEFDRTRCDERWFRRLRRWLASDAAQSRP